MIKSVRVVGVAAVTAALVIAAFSTPATAAPQGAILRAGGATAVKNSYIAVLKDTAALRSRGVPATARELAARHHGTTRHLYQRALRGFSTTMSESDARALAGESAVAYVEQDHAMRISSTQVNPPSWGLDRIDQRNLPLDNAYTHPNTATNVHAYIIDTGIRVTHQTFGGRATFGTNTVGDGNRTDCNGHGTHVAGTVGGSQYGVAKGVSLVAVKVLNCSGSGSTVGVVAGVDWVTQNAQKPAVANMSLGGGADVALDNAVANSIASGVSYSIAAGNSNANACNSSPARVASAITVGATGTNDARASFSNFGTCLDIFAPGVGITSSWNTGDTSTNTISGTSMATPHVVGAAALYLSTHPSAPAQQVRDALVAAATSGKVTSPGTGSSNKLLFVNNGGATPVTVTNPGNKTGVVGTAIAPFTMTASPAGTYTWSATGLPPGITIGAGTGTVSGTPTAAGTFNPTVTATSGAGSGSTTFTFTVTGGGGGCTSPGQKLGNRGFESGSAPWTASAGVIGAWAPNQPAHGGTRVAWLDGYGSTHTDTLSQSVTIPAGCTASTLRFWLHIDSAETTTTIQFDKLTVKVGSTTLATYSNLNKAAGYQLRTFNVGAFAGRTVTLLFTGTEDVSLQTSFVIDDTALNAG